MRYYTGGLSYECALPLRECPRKLAHLLSKLRGSLDDCRGLDNTIDEVDEGYDDRGFADFAYLRGNAEVKNRAFVLPSYCVNKHLV